MQYLLFVLLLLFLTLSQSSHLSQSHSLQFIRNLEERHKGQTIQGLHHIKEYLAKFGYLPHQPSSKNSIDGGSNDSFDGALESAIMAYQRNHHLNVTGALDAATVRQMMVPRCGAPDQDQAAPHYAFFSGAPKWPHSKSNLTYSFIPSVPVVNMEALRVLCARAFRRWATVTHFSFLEIQDPNVADIKIGFFHGEHGDERPFDGPGGVVAHAAAPMMGLFHFDAAEKWGSGGGDVFDVESVAVHEIGHLLGLGHSWDMDAVMYPSLPPGTRKVKLHIDDIRGIRSLYNL